MNLLALIDMCLWIGFLGSLGVFLAELTVKEVIPHYFERLTEKQVKKKRLFLGGIVLFFFIAIVGMKLY